MKNTINVFNHTGPHSSQMVPSSLNSHKTDNYKKIGEKELVNENNNLVKMDRSIQQFERIANSARTKDEKDWRKSLKLKGIAFDMSKDKYICPFREDYPS
jgi:hypothetical protein